MRTHAFLSPMLSYFPVFFEVTGRCVDKGSPVLIGNITYTKILLTLSLLISLGNDHRIYSPYPYVYKKNQSNICVWIWKINDSWVYIWNIILITDCQIWDPMLMNIQTTDLLLVNAISFYRENGICVVLKNKNVGIKGQRPRMVDIGPVKWHFFQNKRRNVLYSQKFPSGIKVYRVWSNYIIWRSIPEF